MPRNRSRNRRPRRPDEAGTPSATPAAPASASTSASTNEVPSPPTQKAQKPSTPAPSSTAEPTSAAPDRPGGSRKPRPEATTKPDDPARDPDAPSRRSSRRRGNRKRGGGGDAIPQPQAGIAAEATPSVATPEHRPNRGSQRGRGDRTAGDRVPSSQVAPTTATAHADASTPRSRGTAPHSDGAAGSDRDRRSGSNAISGAQANANKRRRGPRRKPNAAPEIMPTEVLKPGASLPKPTHPITMRRLEDLGPEGTITLGCPMLTRTKVALPSAGGTHAPRCNLGWSIRNEEEVSFCLRTPSFTECWKAHPERLAELLASDETANDEVSAAD